MTRPNITVSMVYQAMGNFLSRLFPRIEIIQGQIPLTAPPKDAHFIVVGVSSLKRLSSNHVSYENNKKRVRTFFEVPIQIDFYGERSSEMASAFCALFNDATGYDSFPRQVKPLFALDPFQITFTAIHQNYSDRWRVEAYCQINPTHLIDQDFFDEVVIETINV